VHLEKAMNRGMFKIGFVRIHVSIAMLQGYRIWLCLTGIHIDDFFVALVTSYRMLTFNLNYQPYGR